VQSQNNIVSKVALWSNISAVVHVGGSLKGRCENSAIYEMFFFFFHWNITKKSFVGSANFFIKFRYIFCMNTVCYVEFCFNHQMVIYNRIMGFSIFLNRFKS